MSFMAAPVIGSLTGWNLLSIGGTLMQVAGGADQAKNMRSAAVQNAENQRIAAEANQKQLQAQAIQEEAAGQHKAEQDRQKAALMLSRAQAVAAAGGGGPLDESLIAGIVGEGETQAGYSMYESSERAKGLRYRGDVGAYDANARGRQGISEANTAARSTIMGSLVKGAMGLASLAPGAAPGTGFGGGTAYANSGFSTALDNNMWDYR